MIGIRDTLRLRQFAPSPPVFSPDGEWVAYTVVPEVPAEGEGPLGLLPSGAPARLAGAEIRVTRVADAHTVRVAPGEGTAWNPTWAPDGSRLAYCSDRGGVARLWVWEAASGHAQPACERPLGLAGEAPIWAAGGRYLVGKWRSRAAEVMLAESTRRAPGDPDPAGPSLQVWAYDPSAPPAEAQDAGGQGAHLPMLQADVGILDVTTGKLRIVMEDRPVGPLRGSPDGRRVAVLCAAGWAGPSMEEQLWDVWVFDVPTGQPRRVAQGARQLYPAAFSWSPSGRRVACLSQGPGRGRSGFVADADTGEVRPLSCGTGPAGTGAAGTGAAGTGTWLPDDLAMVPPLWLPDEQSLLCHGPGVVWQVFLSGECRPVGAGIPDRLAGVVAPRDQQVAWMPGGSTLFLRAVDEATKDERFYAVDIETGAFRCAHAAARWHWVEWRYSLAYQADVHAPSGRVAMVAEASDAPPELWLAENGFASVRRLTDLNPEWRAQAGALGRSTLLTYALADGRPAQAALLVPAEWRPGRPAPTVVFLYGGERLSHYVHRFGGVGPVHYNFQFWVSRGYAVLAPDMPLESNDPLKELPGVVLPAVDAAVAAGVADPDRLGLFGHSYGGYCVHALIGQSARFRAAVASAGVADLFSAYLSANRHGSSGFPIAWAQGQGRMPGPPWAHPERYVANSPAWYLDRVQTPLLLLHGDEDQAFPVQQAIMMFTGLRSLGKPVTLARYRGEGHSFGGWRRENLIDFWDRVLAWFDRYLKA